MEAVRAAVADAGLELADVDGFVRYAIDSVTPAELASALDLPPPRFGAEDANGGGSASALLGLADAAIARGRARAVVAYRSLNARSGMRLGEPLPTHVAERDGVIGASGFGPGGELTAPYGLLAPGHVFALWARAYMHRHAIDDSRMKEALAAVVTRQRAAAAKTAHAVLRDRPLSRVAYDAEPMIADPLRRADLCLESDGAAAVVLTSPSAAADCRKRPVDVLAVGQALLAGHDDLFLRCAELPPRTPDGWVAELLASVGVSPRDVDVVGTYDATAAHVAFDAESLGLCAVGEGVAWATAPSAACNTSGGLLAEGYVQGMNHVVELVRQLRGEAVDQVPDAELALASAPAVTAVALLARGQR